MKKFRRMFFVLTMICSLSIGQVAFAAETAEPAETTVDSANEETGIQPYGSLSGSFSRAWSAEYAGNRTSMSGTFEVEVKGIPWVNAQTKFTFKATNPKAYASMTLYYPDGTKAWNVEDYWGSPLAPGQSIPKQISPGSIGTYKVSYYVGTYDQSPVGAATLICDIY